MFYDFKNRKGSVDVLLFLLVFFFQNYVCNISSNYFYILIAINDSKCFNNKIGFGIIEMSK